MISENRHNMLTAAGIAPRYHEATLDSFHAETPAQKKALDACRSYSNSFPSARVTGTSLILVGGVGTGKTLLASAMANRVCGSRLTDGDKKIELTAKYTTVMRLLRDIRDCYRKDSRFTEKQILREFIKPDLLVIDEIGVQRGTEDEKIQLFEVLDGRYGHVKPTILVSNLTAPELKDYIGERVIDRLCENGGAVVVFDWESHRRRK